VIETYNTLSEGYYTHATPTLFNSGTGRPQLSSCFLLDVENDSIEGIFNTLKESAQISKNAGGIGISFTKVRSKGTYIAGTNGTSNGIIPFLKIYNETARAVDQGGGKRKGSIAIYLEPWHADIEDFLELKKNSGEETKKARDIFLALWIPDLFMERVRDDKMWSLMCPHKCPRLSLVYGDEFKELYESYEKDKNYNSQISARELFKKIMESQIETGVPYMCYKDAGNRKSNQKNIGTIQSSNLCSEIFQYSDNTEYSVCNLASLNLSKFVENGSYNFEKLRQVAYRATVNLDKVIDITEYPTPETKKSNLAHRPIGLGVQGLADVFYKMKYSFDSYDAQKLNLQIFETIYYGAVSASADLAEKKGSYSTFEGSDFSKGLLQFDMWNCEKPTMWNWDELKKRVKKGMRNSLLTTIMPTASTSQILGNYECIEPPQSNIFLRRTLAGQFTIMNKYLVDDLEKLGLWNEDMKDKIIYNNGSIQDINEIPENIKNLYKTVWELSQRFLIDLSIDRGRFIDQSQSLNLFIDKPDFSRLYNCHMHGWKNGLKTGMYYLRTKPAVNAIKYSLGNKFIKQEVKENEECLVCSS
jgi:ribonucleoside-diphosphate reductase alpha chain